MMPLVADIEAARPARALYHWMAPETAARPRKALATLAVVVLALAVVPITLIVALLPLLVIAAARHTFALTHKHGLPPFSISAVAVSILVYVVIVLVGMWFTRWREVRAATNATPSPEARVPTSE